MEILKQWICDVCGRIIDNTGLVVWNASMYPDNDDEKYFKYKIVHPSGAFDEHGNQYGCDYDHSNYPLSGHLSWFLGGEGLSNLLAMIDVGPLHRDEYEEQITNMRDFLELFRRVQLPYYEEARLYWEEARRDGYFDGASEVWAYLPRTLENLIKSYKI